MALFCLVLARLGRATYNPAQFREYVMSPLSARPSVRFGFGSNHDAVYELRA